MTDQVEHSQRYNEAVRQVYTWRDKMRRDYRAKVSTTIINMMTKDKENRRNVATWAQAIEEPETSYLSEQ
jgi:hypothetical protein